MARSKDKSDRDEAEEAAEASVARDFVMARLAAARGQLTLASSCIDEALGFFVDPDGDKSGKERAALIESADAAISDAARAIQLAGAELEGVDPEEGEPEDEDDES